MAYNNINLSHLARPTPQTSTQISLNQSAPRRELEQSRHEMHKQAAAYDKWLESDRNRLKNLSPEELHYELNTKYNSFGEMLMHPSAKDNWRVNKNNAINQIKGEIAAHKYFSEGSTPPMTGQPPPMAVQPPPAAPTPEPGQTKQGEETMHGTTSPVAPDKSTTMYQTSNTYHDESTGMFGASIPEGMDPVDKDGNPLDHQYKTEEEAVAASNQMNKKSQDNALFRDNLINKSRNELIPGAVPPPVVNQQGQEQPGLNPPPEIYGEGEVGVPKGHDPLGVGGGAGEGAGVGGFGQTPAGSIPQNNQITNSQSDDGYFDFIKEMYGNNPPLQNFLMNQLTNNPGGFIPKPKQASSGNYDISGGYIFDKNTGNYQSLQGGKDGQIQYNEYGLGTGPEGKTHIKGIGTVEYLTKYITTDTSIQKYRALYNDLAKANDIITRWPRMDDAQRQQAKVFLNTYIPAKLAEASRSGSGFFSNVLFQAFRDVPQNIVYSSIDAIVKWFTGNYTETQVAILGGMTGIAQELAQGNLQNALPYNEWIEKSLKNTNMGNPKYTIGKNYAAAYKPLKKPDTTAYNNSVNNNATEEQIKESKRYLSSFINLDENKQREIVLNQVAGYGLSDAQEEKIYQMYVSQVRIELGQQPSYNGGEGTEQTNPSEHGYFPDNWGDN